MSRALPVVLFGGGLLATLLFPALQSASQLPKLELALGVSAAALLVLGTWTRRAALLFGAYPAALGFVVLSAPEMLRAPLRAPVVAATLVSELAVYLLCCCRLLDAHVRPVHDGESEISVEAARDWQMFARVSGYFAAVIVATPVVILGTLYLRHGTQRAFERLYPDRPREAGILFGLILLTLWATVAQSLYKGLHDSLRGDVALRWQISRLGRSEGSPRLTYRLWAYGFAALGLLVTWVFLQFFR